MGLEAVSRGAEHAVFVENNKKAAACIEENIQFTKLTDQCTLLVKDVAAAISWMEGKEIFDIVFLDPPYGKELEKKALEALAASSLLTEDALVILETSVKTEISWLEETGYEITKEKVYKTNRHIFLRFVKS